MSFNEDTIIRFDEDIVDEPLIIVLDDDDDDDDEFDSFDITTTMSEQQSTIVEKDDLLNVEVKNLIESLAVETTTKSKVFHRNESEKANQVLRTVVFDTSFQNQRTRTKISKRKHTSTKKSPSSDDSILSYISFDKVPNIITISRMGSTYYCIEDLYMKVFSSLCTLDEFTDLLTKSGLVILKQVTLSEKITINKRNVKLNKLNQVRYRLISINMTDYLIKLKQLLLANKKQKSFDQIIEEMRTYKQILNNKVSQSTDNDDKNFKTVAKKNESTQFGIFIQCNGPVSCNIFSTNESISSPTISKLDSPNSSESPVIKTENNNDEYQSNLTEFSLNTSETLHSIEDIPKNQILNSYDTNSSDPFSDLNSFSISSPLPNISLHRLNRTKSLANNFEKNEKDISRSSSLPSIKFNIKDHIMLTPQSTVNNDNYLMPMIVNVEENVELNNQNVKNSQPYLSSSNKTSPPPPYPNLYQSPPIYSTSYQQSYLPNKKKKPKKNPPPPPQLNSNLASSTILPSSQELNYYNSSASKQHISSTACHLPCCSKPKTKVISTPNERMNYQQYLTSDFPTTRESPKVPSSMHRQQRRIESTPYPPTKIYFHPSYKQHLESQKKTDIYRPIPPVVVQNSSTLISPPNTPHDLTLPNICTRSIDLARAITLHGQCNTDKIPKLVVRHSKTYANKTIDTMGQLFPTWFVEPHYRCIHCFSCDQVFTPQQFMIHVDDEKLVNEPLLHMTSIQLLTSEKMSEVKVELWNQFCTNLTIYASKHAEAEKKKQLTKRRSDNRIRKKLKVLDKGNQAASVPSGTSTTEAKKSM